MGIKIYNKTTAGRRFASVNDYAELTERDRPPCKALLRAKPATSKGRYVKGVFISSTMGPGIRVDANAVQALVKV